MKIQEELSKGLPKITRKAQAEIVSDSHDVIYNYLGRRASEGSRSPSSEIAKEKMFLYVVVKNNVPTNYVLASKSTIPDAKKVFKIKGNDKLVFIGNYTSYTNELISTLPKNVTGKTSVLNSVLGDKLYKEANEYITKYNKMYSHEVTTEVKPYNVLKDKKLWSLSNITSLFASRTTITNVRTRNIIIIFEYKGYKLQVDYTLYDYSTKSVKFQVAVTLDNDEVENLNTKFYQTLLDKVKPKVEKEFKSECKLMFEQIWETERGNVEGFEEYYTNWNPTYKVTGEYDIDTVYQGVAELGKKMGN